MAKPEFKLNINQNALTEIRKQALEVLTPRVQEIFDGVHATAEGKSADQIAHELAQGFKAIGGSATPSELKEWAQTIASGERIVFLPKS